jgi:hypothetical protein
MGAFDRAVMNRCGSAKCKRHQTGADLRRLTWQ